MADDARKPFALHYVWKYLSITEGWIHSQIVHLRRYRPAVITEMRENKGVFSVPHIHALPRVTCNEGLAAKIVNGLIQALSLGRLWFLTLVLAHHPSVVHVHFGNSGWEHLFIKRILKRKYIVSFYGYDYSFLLAQNPVWKRRYQELFREGDAFIVEGPNARRTLISLGCPEEKLFENHLGVNLSEIEFTERKPPGPGESIRLLQIASFVEKKGHQFTVYAFAEALEEVPNLSLTFIGSGELQGAIERLVSDLGLGNRVNFIPALPYREILKIAQDHHIFVHPSIHASDGNCEGGAPVVLLDMQASGMPVIATRHCDIPDYVLDRFTGFLVEEKDVPALAERIIYLATHAELWPLFGRRGRNHVSREFDAQRQAERLEEIYDKVVNLASRMACSCEQGREISPQWNVRK